MRGLDLPEELKQ